MQVVETNSDSLLKDFKVTVAAADIEARIDSRLSEVGQDARIPGFRPGKAPVAILKQRFGPAVRGEILDLACYLGHGATGEEHAPCALKCVKAGQPMGLMASDGKVYLLVASHHDATAFEQAKELAGKQVELSGTSMSRDGIQAVEVLAVKKL